MSTRNVPDRRPEDSVAARHLFDARIAEYSSARDELFSAISNQHLVLTFGTASIVGVFVAGLLTWDEPVSWAVFLAVPPISAWILAMWLAEVVRMLRAVAFCRDQASVVNRSLGLEEMDCPPLRWEAWRDQEPGRTVRWSYISVVVTLSGAYITAVPLGLITADLPWPWTSLVALAFTAGLAIVLTAVFAVYRRWSTPASKVGMPQRG